MAFKTHLQFTAKTIIAALSFKNLQAVGWGVDMLNHWLENFKSGATVHQSYMWNSVLLNYFLLNRSEDDPIWAPIIHQDKFSREIAYEFAFQNYHLDLRVITACYILRKNRELPLEFAKEMIEALLKGYRIHPTSISESPKSISNAGELVGTYIRHRNHSQSSENPYGLWLNKIVESYGHLFKGQLITGRTYMGVAENINSLRDNYIEIALSFSKNQWDLPHKWYQALSSSFYRIVDIDSIIADLESWIVTLNTWQERNYEYILFEKEVFSLHKENFISSVQNIISKLKNQSNQIIINASISQDKIMALATIASSAIQDSQHVYPFKFFKVETNINPVGNFHEGSLIFTDYEKKYVTEDVDSKVVIIGEEWVKDAILGHLTKFILDKVLQTPISHIYSSGSVEDLLKIITMQVGKIEEPVILVGNHEFKNILHRCRWQKSDVIAKIIDFQDIKDEGYICHIYKSEVYDLFFEDVDCIILTSKQVFESLSFHNYDKSQLFEVSFEQKDQNSLIGDLIFKYQIALKFNESYPIFKFNLNMIKDD